MNLRGTTYDPDLQMFTDPPRELDLSRLRFLRWLAEREQLEHAPVGEPSGEFARCVWTTGRPVTRQSG